MVPYEEREPEIKETDVDREAVRLLGEMFDPPILIGETPGHADWVWSRMAGDFHNMGWEKLDAAVAEFAGANTPEGQRAHELLMNVWHFKAEGDVLRMHG